MIDSLKQLVKAVGLPRLTIVLFLVVLLVIGAVNRLPISMLLGNSLVRIGMNGIMVLAMVPSVQSGAGLNFGLSIGIIAGLLGMLVVMEFKIGGLLGLALALLIAAVLGVASGYVYGLILNRVRGQEMMIGTYVGFSIVSAMCMFWIMAPFKNPEMIWVISGKGLRTTLPVSDSMAQILDKLWGFSIFGMKVPTGLLLAFALACLLLGLFNRTRLGISMRIAGANPTFAMSCGIDVDKMRILGTVLSTALGAMGMVVYKYALDNLLKVRVLGVNIPVLPLPWWLRCAWVSGGCIRPSWGRNSGQWARIWPWHLLQASTWPVPGL